MTYTNIKVVVVDNGSTNHSVDVLSCQDDITLIRNETNLGFAGGNNVAIKYALDHNADYIWLLNSDAVVASDCLQKLILAAGAEVHIGLASPVIYHLGTQNAVQHCGTRLNQQRNGVQEAADITTARKWQFEDASNVILWGTALLIAAPLAKAIGGLDEALFAYSEDTDYSIRSSRAGFKNITVFDSCIWHASTTELRKPHYYYYTIRNAGLMWRKYTTAMMFLKICVWNAHRVKSSIHKFAGRPDLVHASKLGLWHGWVGVGGAFESTATLPLLPRLFLALILR
jgi:GT2 family glycosyltransferase